MPANDFITIPEELIHVAADAETYFANQGYEVVVEGRAIGFPFTPALVCERRHEMLIVEVLSSLDQKRIDRWLRYCRSQTTDTRFCAVLRNPGGVNQATVAFAVENRLGLCVHDDRTLIELRAPADLAVQIALPELTDLKPAVRPLLAPAFQKVREGDWRDGLGHAYLEVEQLARDYLSDGITAGRIVATIQQGNRTITLTPNVVDRMTLGRLKNAYMGIQNQTHKDALIGTTLAMIHETRDGLAHARRTPAMERKLRAQVGQNMYAAITCLEELTS